MNRILPIALGALLLAGAARAGDDESAKLVAKLIEDNAAWLRPAADDFSFTFGMKHEEKDDKTELLVEFKAPSTATYSSDGKSKTVKLDNVYDSNNTAYPPALQTTLQGTTIFGPLQELALDPGVGKLTPIGEETLNGKAALVFKLVSIGEPSGKAMAKWEEKVKGAAARSQNIYSLKAVIADGPEGKRPELRAESLLQPGPRWPELEGSLKSSPHQLVWNAGGTYTKYTALIMADAKGVDRAWLAVEAAETATLAPEATLYDAAGTIDKSLFEAFKRLFPKPNRFLPMRVGCGGVGCGWYGYSGGGADTDKIWIDKKTGVPLREEGYWNGALGWDIDYKEFAQAPGGKTVPTRLVVTLDRKDRDPWVFDIRFKLHEGGRWLMDSLDEYQRGKLSAKGWTSNIVAKKP